MAYKLQKGEEKQHRGNSTMEVNDGKLETKTWLDRLTEPLSNPKYPQIRGRLIEKDGQGSIVGKCAEGEIACYNNIPIEGCEGFLENDLLRNLGIPSDFVYGGLPKMTLSFITGQEKIDFRNVDHNIGDYIINLNDSGFTYPQIVEFLKETFGDAV